MKYFKLLISVVNYRTVTASSFQTMSFICSPAVWVMTSELLQENSAWVDQRLEELYHGYGLTAENCDDYIDAGLLAERSAWVDAELQTQCDSEFDDTHDQYILCPAGMSWVLYKNYDTQHCLEEERRSRAESDISDHSDEVEQALKRVDTGMFTNEYLHIYAVADEVSSASSLEAKTNFDYYSETSNDWFVEDDGGYDSF